MKTSVTMRKYTVRLELLHIVFGVRAEARRSYGMRSDFVKGRQQLLEPFSRS
jgi:hypothetical protein